MRKIEKRMLQAVAGCYDWKESNTQVINNKNGVFVRLYNTIIFAKVGGAQYFSDGGFSTVTTGSRLRALGAAYSTNAKKNASSLVPQNIMRNLYFYGVA